MIPRAQSPGYYFILLKLPEHLFPPARRAQNLVIPEPKLGAINTQPNRLRRSRTNFSKKIHIKNMFLNMKHRCNIM